jgi:hypothetical protein
MTKMFLTIFLSLLLTPALTEIQIIDLPSVSEITEDQVTFRINYLKTLLPTYNWIFCNKGMLQNAAIQASEILHQAAAEMKNYTGNVVKGNNNVVAGVGNIVLGSNNTFVGLNSWCFTSDYKTPKGLYDEGVLAVGNYKIYLSKVSLIA